MKKKAPEKSYKIFEIDPWLKPYRRDIQLRMDRFTDIRKMLLGADGDLSSMANGYLYYGIHRTENGWVYREWAPGADELHLIGDFNGWNEPHVPPAEKGRRRQLGNLSPRGRLEARRPRQGAGDESGRQD